MMHMIRSILLMLLFLTVPATASEAPDVRLSDDIAFTKATIALLATKDFTSVRDRLDSGIGQASDETLDRMSNLFGVSEPASIPARRRARNSCAGLQACLLGEVGCSACGSNER